KVDRWGENTDENDGCGTPVRRAITSRRTPMSWPDMPVAVRNRLSGSSWVARRGDRDRESYRLDSGASTGAGVPGAYRPSVTGRRTMSEASVRPTVHRSDAMVGPVSGISGAWKPGVP